MFENSVYWESHRSATVQVDGEGAGVLLMNRAEPDA